MQKNHSVFLLAVFLFGGIAICFSQSGSGLPPYQRPERIPYKARDYSVNHSRSTSKLTLPFSSSQPFFDDFSTGTVPDTMLWDLKATPDNLIYPNLTTRGAVNPPSLGVVTFDGISPLNRTYEPFVSIGPADRLESHYIDLTGSDAGHNIRLTFFLQPQGVGDRPFASDSFKVYLNTASGNVCDENLELVYAQTGSSLTPFKQVSIPIDHVKYFHSEFYMVFENVGPLYGPIAHWHLDYVTLARDRAPSDTFYNDRSVCYLNRPPMDPYTAIPFQQYTPSTHMNPFEVIVSNLRSSSSNTGVLSEITDPVGSNIFAPPYSVSGSKTLSGYTQATIDLSAFSDGNTLSSPYAASFLNTISLTSGDAVSQNNTLVEEYRIDSLYAYDDGEADFSFGLNRSRGFGQQFEIFSEDSIMAVWLSFVPSVDVVRGKSMEGSPFRFTIWDDPHPDSVFFRQSAGMTVEYGGGPNYFHRYPLTRAVSLPPGTYWMGIIQFSDAPIGLGMDRSYENNSLVRYDSLGFWGTSTNNGTLMIRPEMRNIAFNPGPFASIETPKEILQGSFSIAPNPTSTGNFRLTYDGKTPVRELRTFLMDIRGNHVCQSSLASVGNRSMDIQCSGLPSGIYFLRIQGFYLNGQTFQLVKKVMIKNL